MSNKSLIRLAGAAAFVAYTVAAGAQTRVDPPKNSYTPSDDVKLGRQAASQAEQQFPVLRDDGLTSYVGDIGRRLVNAIPPELQHPEFQVLLQGRQREGDQRLRPPGRADVCESRHDRSREDRRRSRGRDGPRTESRCASTRDGAGEQGDQYEIGAIAGQVLGAIIGGNVGSVVAQGSQFGLGAAFMRFSREYERQADIEGAQIMARAGYDPRDMANMFKTIEAQGGGSGMPEWLSDHPDPGNRYEYILREAQALRVTNPVRDTRGFEQAQARLRQMSPAPTTAEVSRKAENRPRGTSGTASGLGRVDPPSPRFVTYRAGTLFQINVPDNWRQLPGSQSVTFAPEGGYATSGGQSVFTHGVEAGEAPAAGRDLQAATDGLIASLAQANPGLSRAGIGPRLSAIVVGYASTLRTRRTQRGSRNASSCIPRCEMVICSTPSPSLRETISQRTNRRLRSHRIAAAAKSSLGRTCTNTHRPTSQKDATISPSAVRICTWSGMRRLRRRRRRGGNCCPSHWGAPGGSYSLRSDRRLNPMELVGILRECLTVLLERPGGRERGRDRVSDEEHSECRRRPPRARVDALVRLPGVQLSHRSFGSRC